MLLLTHQPAAKSQGANTCLDHLPIEPFISFSLDYQDLCSVSIPDC